MRTHRQIDERSLSLAKAVVEKIDTDPLRSGLEKARSVCSRWLAQHGERVAGEWHGLLKGGWEDIRAALLEQSERGTRLRYSSPFCGVISARERWDIYRSHGRDSKTV